MVHETIHDMIGRLPGCVPHEMNRLDRVVDAGTDGVG